jgi:hypothetical protein
VKRLFALSFFAILLIALVATIAYPQLTGAKDSKGNYLPTTIMAAHSYATGVDSTTRNCYLGSGAKSVICYLITDTVASACTLNVAIYGSPNGTKWIADSVFTEVTAAGALRIYIPHTDPYIRFRYHCTGTAHVYGSLVILPRP